MVEYKRIKLEEREKIYLWQKGSNENFNGRLRRYLPKTYNPNMISQAMLDAIAKKMNNQLRKCLGFLTPADVFYVKLYQGIALEALKTHLLLSGL